MEIKEITLLSVAEYQSCKNVIPQKDTEWFLRDAYREKPGAGYADWVGVVNSQDHILNGVLHDINAVAPALILDTTRLHPGDKVEFAGHKWTVIAEDMIFMDDYLEDMEFDNNPDAIIADYMSSSVRAYLENWLNAHKDEPMYLVKDGEARIL